MKDQDLLAIEVEEKFNNEFGGKWELANSSMKEAVLEETTDGRAVAKACKFVVESHNLRLECVYGVELGGTRIVIGES